MSPSPKQVNTDERIEQLVMFLDALPDVGEYKYQEGGKYYITSEWLCGEFSGRSFVGDTPEDSAGQLIEYFDNHINHRSMVGNAVTDSGWPNLDEVKNHI